MYEENGNSSGELLNLLVFFYKAHNSTHGRDYASTNYLAIRIGNDVTVVSTRVHHYSRN